MKTFFLLFLSIFWGFDLASQSLEIKPTCVYDYRVEKFLVKKDSLVLQYDDPLISILRFYVRFNKVFFDKSTGEFSMAGKVCSTSGDCWGVPRISIFKASKNNDKTLHGINRFAETSFGGDSLVDDGNFCFKINIRAGESIFFSMPGFYLEEFKLGEFVEKSSTKKVQSCFISEL